MGGYSHQAPKQAEGELHNPYSGQPDPERELGQEASWASWRSTASCSLAAGLLCVSVSVAQGLQQQGWGAGGAACVLQRGD